MLIYIIYPYNKHTTTVNIISFARKKNSQQWSRTKLHNLINNIEIEKTNSFHLFQWAKEKTGKKTGQKPHLEHLCEKCKRIGYNCATIW